MPHQLHNPAPSTAGGPHHSLSSAETTPELEMMEIDDRLREEFNQLVAANKELLSKSGSCPDFQMPPEKPNELAEVRRERDELQSRLEEMEQLLKEALASEETWQVRQRDYESLLEEKSEVIRNLHLKIQQLQEKPDENKAPAQAFTPPPQLIAMQKDLEEQRRQLEQDEESLMRQMREMEMAMSRDRAELARQRNELKRMNEDLQHELEMVSRDAGLRERLSAFRARHQEAIGIKDHSPQPQAAAAAAPTPEPRPGSGFFKKMFGK